MAKQKTSLLDRSISYVFPRIGVRRAAARRALDVVRSYEAASAGARTGGWHTSAGSANAETHGALGRMRDRSRDLVRNNPYIERGIRVIAANVVGDGIVPHFKGKNESQIKTLEELWKAWAGSTDCDADGLLDFYMMQNASARAMAESGEGLALRRGRRLSDGLPVPLQIQLVEGDYLDDGRDTLATGDRNVFQGVEFDKLGRRVKYWLFRDHPGNPNASPVGYGTSKGWDARDVAHIFRVDRPGQVRGAPWTAPIVIRARDFDEYEDAQLLRQKLAACYVGFKYDNEAPNDAVDGADTEVDTLNPGTIETLANGQRIEFANPPGVDGYGEYTKQVLHAIAAGLGATYEQLTGDMSEANYSQARMGALEFNRNLIQWRKILIRQLCAPSMKWFLEAARLAGHNVDGVAVEWTPPRREMLDPGKETRAKVTAIRAGFWPLSEEHRSSGRVSSDVLEEIAAVNKVIDSKKLILTSDPRQNVQAEAQ